MSAHFFAHNLALVMDKHDLEAELHELAAIEAESTGWQPLEPGAYLHVRDVNVTEVLVVGIPQAGAAVLLVG